MNKIVCLVVLAILLNISSASAKVIFVGSHGGVATYTKYFSDGKYFDPLDEYDNIKPGSPWNDVKEVGNKDGVDATIMFLRSGYYGEIRARIYEDTAKVSSACDWIDDNYESGDYVFLVGYSAGGKFVRDLSSALKDVDIPVHFMGMIDPIIAEKISIPSNVLEVDVYVQNTDGWFGTADFLQGFSRFVVNKRMTELHCFTIEKDGIDHLSIDNWEVVWKSLGLHMLRILGIRPGTNYDWPEVETHDEAEIYEMDPEQTAIDISEATDDEVDIPGSGEIGDANLSIRSFTLGIEGQPDDSCVHKLELAMAPGESIKIKGRLEVKNKGEIRANACDFDYRIEKERNFDKNDPKLDEDEGVDIDPGETVTEFMRNVTISVSSDGATVKICGPSDCRSFDVADSFVKAYIFADVEGGGDRDVSSETDKTEYGVVEITVVRSRSLAGGDYSWLLPIINYLLD